MPVTPLPFVASPFSRAISQVLSAHPLLSRLSAVAHIGQAQYEHMNESQKKEQYLKGKSSLN
jgi:hypothetical protein